MYKDSHALLQQGPLHYLNLWHACDTHVETVPHSQVESLMLCISHAPSVIWITLRILRKFVLEKVFPPSGTISYSNSDSIYFNIYFIHRLLWFNLLWKVLIYLYDNIYMCYSIYCVGQFLMGNNMAQNLKSCEYHWNCLYSEGYK